MIDAHCHIDFQRFDEDRAQVLAAARAVGVTRLISAGFDRAGWARQAAVVASHPEVVPVYGLHPQVAATLTPEELEDAMASLSARRGVGIGETGLDLGRFAPRGSLPRQMVAFRGHLALARERNLPVVLHVLGAHGPALDTLRRDGLSDAGGMMHSYSGSAELVPLYEKLGLYVSLAASVTRRGARRAVAAAAAVAAGRLLIETDCPDQVPTGATGARNVPGNLPVIAAAVAAARGEATEDVGRRTAENARRLFAL